MTVHVITVLPDTDIRSTAKLLLDNRISAVPVVDAAGKLVGLVSEGDLVRRAEAETEHRHAWWLSMFADSEAKARAFVKTHGRRVADVMTRRVFTVDEDASVEDVAHTLEKHRIKRVPVMKNGQVVGIISRANILHGLIARQSAHTPSADDRSIKAAILKELREAGISRHLLNIVVSGGVVHVWGIAETAEERDAVRIAAETAEGVSSVECNINVPPPGSRAVLWAE